MAMLKLQLIIYFSVTITLTSVESARILGLFPYPLKSHFIIFDALLTELANRGHEVTVVTPFPKNDLSTNYSQINVAECMDKETTFTVEDSLEYRSPLRSLNKIINNIWLFDELLECNAMKELKSAQDNYDLVITELFITDVLLAYPYIYNKPFILFNTLPLVTRHTEHVASIDNPSIIPYTFIDYSFDIKYPTFIERLYNSILYVASKAYYHFEWIKTADKIVLKHFGDSIPSTAEIAKNVSLIFTYTHFSTHRPRPQVPAVIEVGGMHIGQPKPLPQDIKTFIDESKDGVIYFCLGSLMRMQSMPDTIRHAFNRAFAKFPQRILWKWENETMPEKSDKIMIKDWMPQRDILAHPNIKLFITHGGSLGINEAVYEAVPIIAVPVYGDQNINSRTIMSAGAGEILQYYEISEETITTAIEKVLYDKKYAENMKKLSNIYKDRPATAIETAIYWTEFVLRHKGAPHLKSAAVYLRWYQYLLLDVITVIAISTTIVFYLIWKTLLLFNKIVKNLLIKKQKYKRH